VSLIYAIPLLLAVSAAHAADIDCDNAAPVAAYLHHRAMSTPVHRHEPRILRKPVAQVGCTRESLHGVVPVVLNEPVQAPVPIVVPPVATVADITPNDAIAAATPFPVKAAGGALLLGAVLCIEYRCGGSGTSGHETTGTTGTTGSY